jgi:hypothetical protein
LSSLSLFWKDSRGNPLVAAYKLAAEYLTFFAAVGFALTLGATRLPMRVLDRALGLRLRERFIDLIARISPG